MSSADSEKSAEIKLIELLGRDHSHGLGFLCDWSSRLTQVAEAIDADRARIALELVQLDERERALAVERGCFESTVDALTARPSVSINTKRNWGSLKVVS